MLPFRNSQPTLMSTIHGNVGFASSQLEDPTERSPFGLIHENVIEILHHLWYLALTPTNPLGWSIAHQISQDTGAILQNVIRSID